MGRTYTSLFSHIVFSTKDRSPFLYEEMRAKLFPYMGGIVRQLKGTALNINGPQDHVHCLVLLPASLAVADVVRKLKSNSSKWVHETFAKARTFAWQAGYSAFSVSKSGVPEVSEYIARQEQHHARMSFQEELRAFLAKHEIEYDERYIWE